MATKQHSQSGQTKRVNVEHSAKHGDVDEAKELGLGFERIVFFSDAVFAIAITLLALEIHVGEIADNLVDVELPGRLLELWPLLLGYFLGFSVIGGFWAAHHRLFNYFRRYDGKLIVLNLLFLALIALSPFPANVIGEYGLHQSAQIFYAASVSLTGFLWYFIWLYASRHDFLTDPAVGDWHRLHEGTRGLFVPLAFLFSIPFTWLGPVVPILIWVAAPFASSLLLQRK